MRLGAILKRTCSAKKPHTNRVMNSSKSGESVPPITSTISAVNLKGAVSMLPDVTAE